MKTFDIFSWKIKHLSICLKGEKRVALASFPRSGNTWLRFMIEEATGKPSGSVYHDRVFPRDRKGIVIKTHQLDSYQYTHAIHLVRNPFDAIESYFWYMKEISQKEVDWTDHVIQSIEQWRAHTEHWSQVKYPVLTVRYEDLLTNTEYELDRILSWLGFDLSPKELSVVIEKASFGQMRESTGDIGKKFFRKGRKGTGIKHFNEEQRAFLFSSLQDLLIMLGYNNIFTYTKDSLLEVHNETN